MARGAVATALRQAPGAFDVIAPPAHMAGTPGRLSWELLWVPRHLERHPDVVFSPFNVAPTRWRAAQPRIGIIISSLAPFSRELCAMYRGVARARLEAIRRLTIATMDAAERIFILSEQARAMLDLDAHGDRVELIPMAPPRLDSPHEHGIDLDNGDGRPTMLVVAHLMRYKGVEWTLDAVRRLPPHERPLLLIAGKPLERAYTRHLRELETRHRLHADIRWLGDLRHERVLALMRHVTACVVPSRFENPGRVPVEAMALGTPVIASDIPAFREACGSAAAYFPPADTERLAEVMRTVVADPSLRARLVAAGNERIVQLRPDSATRRIMAWMRGDEATQPGSPTASAGSSANACRP